ncbi:MAG: c-type cytochrome [Caldilineaceae bacterium]
MDNSVQPPTVSPARQRRGCGWLIGLIIGVILTLILVVLVGMPLAVAHRQDLPLERVYGDLAVELAVGMQAGSAQNPTTQNSRRALESGRYAYTGSCAVCHGVNGDGKGAFGEALYPPATNLQGRDTQEKSDAKLFWIIKNGLSFLGMPSYASQYDDSQIWALVAYVRSLGNPATRQGAEIVPTPTTEQLAIADPSGDPVHRGAAVYFAEGCHTCHGAVGNAPGELHLRSGREAAEAVREGRRGMPKFGTAQISDNQLTDLVAYVNTFSASRQ